MKNTIPDSFAEKKALYEQLQSEYSDFTSSGGVWDKAFDQIDFRGGSETPENIREELDDKFFPRQFAGVEFSSLEEVEALKEKLKNDIQKGVKNDVDTLLNES